MKWMTCQEPLDDDSWSRYCNEIEAMGLETLTKAYETAYQRYMAR